MKINFHFDWMAALTAFLVLLKVTGPAAGLGWFWVFTPLWLWLLCWVLLAVFVASILLFATAAAVVIGLRSILQ